jgi:hypothetical protein
MLDQIAIRLDGKVYLYRLNEGDTLRLWVSKQSLLPLTPANHTLQLVGQMDYAAYHISDYTRVPILCDRSIYTGIPAAKLTHKPTQRTIPLYPSREWLDFLHSHKPITLTHNNRYWVFSDYDADQVQTYRALNGKWNATYRCWVFQNIPPAPPFKNALFCPLASLLSPV